ncbi:MAG: nucleotide exchange factor GrpE [Oscillospiraceae bacterium]|nr:nucleotide exchange factor GrpE [Oscillospiraceae bacterium]
MSEHGNEIIEEILDDMPEEEMDPVQAELEEWKDRALRTQADFENFRRRNIKERESVIVDIRAATLAALLPVYDNLLRALQQPTEDAAYAKGVELTLAQLLGIFEDLGVVPFGNTGENFDPNICEAVMHVEDETIGNNIIVEVFAQGFKMGDKILRHAVVKVAN